MATISKSFTAVGVSEPLLVKHGDAFTYDVSGTFVGTVIIEKSQVPNQYFNPTGISATAAASGTIIVSNPDQGTAYFRFRCSAFTSGTIVTSLVDVVSVIQTFNNGSGETVLSLTETGISTPALTVSGLSTGIVHSSSAGVQSSSTVVTADLANSAVTAVKIDPTVGAVKVHKMSVGFAALNTATTGVAGLFGNELPAAATIVRAYYHVTQTFAGDGNDGSTIKMGLEDQDDDVKVAIAISDVTNPFDAGFHEGIQVGTAATMIKTTVARQLAVTWTAGGTDTALTAGAMSVYVEFVGA